MAGASSRAAERTGRCWSTRIENPDSGRRLVPPLSSPPTPAPAPVPALTQPYPPPPPTKQPPKPPQPPPLTLILTPPPSKNKIPLRNRHPPRRLRSAHFPVGLDDVRLGIDAHARHRVVELHVLLPDAAAVSHGFDPVAEVVGCDGA